MSNWEYFNSKALGMKAAYNKKTGQVMTEDKVLYSPDELKLIQPEISPEVHIVKRIFSGTIVDNVSIT